VAIPRGGIVRTGGFAIKRKAVRSLGLIVAVVSLLGLSAPSSSGGTSLPACSDRAYKLDGTKWTTPFRWRFQGPSTPKTLRRLAVQRRLVRAASTVASGRNRCGLVSHVSANQRYLGRTSAHPNIRPNGSCGTPDGRNEVGFGTLPWEYMALTCYWSKNGSTIEADIMFNKTDYRWATRVKAGCSMTWDIQAVATHEFGHAFGLAHVKEGLHGHLTMAPYILPCQNAESRLGLGDLRGMRALY
jgi:hypothetical protein